MAVESAESPLSCRILTRDVGIGEDIEEAWQALESRVTDAITRDRFERYGPRASFETPALENKVVLVQTVIKSRGLVCPHAQTYFVEKKVLVGRTDRAFCKRVSDFLDTGTWFLHESPAIAQGVWEDRQLHALVSQSLVRLK